MVDIEARIQNAIEDITGNESLLEMLDEEAAAEMLEWGKSMVTFVVKKTDGLDDAAAQLALDPQLKAVRQFMRSASNWAGGKYVDPDDRLQLRDKLLGHAKVIFGDDAHLPSAEEMDAILSQTDIQQNTQKQLALNLMELFTEAS